MKEALLSGRVRRKHSDARRIFPHFHESALWDFPWRYQGYITNDDLLADFTCLCFSPSTELITLKDFDFWGWFGPSKAIQFPWSLKSHEDLGWIITIMVVLHGYPMNIPWILHRTITISIPLVYVQYMVSHTHLYDLTSMISGKQLYIYIPSGYLT